MSFPIYGRLINTLPNRQHTLSTPKTLAERWNIGMISPPLPSPTYFNLSRRKGAICRAQNRMDWALRAGREAKNASRL